MGTAQTQPYRTGNIAWKRVGREWHSTDGRFQVYCAGRSQSFNGSAATWTAVDTAADWRTSASSRIGAMEACERQNAR